MTLSLIAVTIPHYAGIFMLADNLPDCCAFNLLFSFFPTFMFEVNVWPLPFDCGQSILDGVGYF